MRTINSYNLCLALIISFMMPVQALAIPAITCHCFKDRSFDPARPAAADQYFLATAQNSFFAAVFHVDKKTVVMKKQQGASSDDLWIAYWVASRSGISPENLFQSKQDKEEWREAIVQLRLPAKSLGARFSTALQARKPAAGLADTVVDELFQSYRLLSDGELAALRKAGASNQEMIISRLVSEKTGQPARQVLLEVKKGAKTWGGLLLGAKIDAKNIQQEISALLKVPPR